MKSIKEKAEESSLGYDEVQAPAIGRGFVLGANYMLEEIEQIVNSAIENKSMTLPTWRLNYIIKQLKK